MALSVEPDPEGDLRILRVIIGMITRETVDAPNRRFGVTDGERIVVIRLTEGSR